MKKIYAAKPRACDVAQRRPSSFMMQYSTVQYNISTIQSIVGGNAMRSSGNDRPLRLTSSRRGNHLSVMVRRSLASEC
jgi:hypothetical protein